MLTMIKKILVLDNEEIQGVMEEQEIDDIKDINIRNASCGDYIKFGYVIDDKCIFYNDNIHKDIDCIEEGMFCLNKNIFFEEHLMEQTEFEKTYNVKY